MSEIDPVTGEEIVPTTAEPFDPAKTYRGEWVMFSDGLIGQTYTVKPDLTPEQMEELFPGWTEAVSDITIPENPSAPVAELSPDLVDAPSLTLEIPLEGLISVGNPLLNSGINIEDLPESAFTPYDPNTIYVNDLIITADGLRGVAYTLTPEEIALIEMNSSLVSLSADSVGGNINLSKNVTLESSSGGNIDVPTDLTTSANHQETISELDPLTGEAIFDQEAFFTRALEAVKNGQPVPRDPNVIWGDPNAVTVADLETTLSMIRQSKTPEMQALYKAGQEEVRKLLESGTYQPIELPPDFVPPMLTPSPLADGTPWDFNASEDNSPVDRMLARMGVPEGPVTIPFSEVPPDSPFYRFIEHFI